MTEQEPKGRMWQLIAKSRSEKLTEEEKRELQCIFLRIAAQDLEVLADQGMLEPNNNGDTREEK